MERIEGLGPKRAPRVHRSVAEKRQIVELSLQPGMSVARATQTAGVNANQVFKWRQDYRSGLLLESMLKWRCHHLLPRRLQPAPSILTYQREHRLALSVAQTLLCFA